MLYEIVSKFVARWTVKTLGVRIQSRALLSIFRSIVEVVYIIYSSKEGGLLSEVMVGVGL